MNLIYPVVLLPFLGFFILTFTRYYLSKIFSFIISIFTIFLSLLISTYILFLFHKNSGTYSIPLWEWLLFDDFSINFSFFLDKQSLLMTEMVLFVSLCIHIFSIWYMNDKENENIRYFSYLNLFVGCMLFLLLSNNLIMMYLGWEAVGFCSYLLVGFYYKNIKNGYAAIKSFLMTKISDVFFLISIFLIFLKFKTVTFETLNFLLFEKKNLYLDTPLLSLISILLCIGAIGKSAQFPLHTWLSDAMVGPTPSSALIHAATMVTSGIFLMIRMYPLFLISPISLKFISIIGIITLIISSISATLEVNIKKILAYSTMSQIGYMFISIGVLNCESAILHLVSHAFFKSLLFLSSGSIINFSNGEKNIFKLGGLYKKIPWITYISFLIGSLSLISFPILTACFFTKSNILMSVFYSGNKILLFFSFLGIFLTSIYVIRMFFFVFYGTQKSNIRIINTDWTHNFPLFLLILGCTPLLLFLINKYIFSFEIFHTTYSSSFFIESLAFILTFFGFFIFYLIYKNYYYLLKFNLYVFLLNMYKHISLNDFYIDYFYKITFISLILNFFKIFKKNIIFRFIEKFTIFFFFLEKYFYISENRSFDWYIFVILITSLTFLFLYKIS